MASEEGKVATPIGVAVALVALTRFIAMTNPTLLAHLTTSLRKAEAMGIAPGDLDLLRTLIRTISPV